MLKILELVWKVENLVCLRSLLIWPRIYSCEDGRFENLVWWCDFYANWFCTSLIYCDWGEIEIIVYLWPCFLECKGMWKLKFVVVEMWID
jgi:hypothetical protein